MIFFLIITMTKTRSCPTGAAEHKYYVSTRGAFKSLDRVHPLILLRVVYPRRNATRLQKDVVSIK